MPDKPLYIVTGAFGYSGRHIARRLLAEGIAVRTLTHRPGGDDAEFGRQIDVRPYNFDRPDELERSLRGAQVLYNTYWARMDRPGRPTQAQAVQNTFHLFEAARTAGVRRIVHLSITNASLDSPYEYFRYKAQIEQMLIQSGLSYAIIRPAAMFGGRDVLINNMAWTIRHLPVIGLFGDGRYRMDPIHVDDLADMAIDCAQRQESVIVDAVGPEKFTYRGLLEELCRILGKRRLLVSMPPRLAYSMVWMMGKLVGDVIVSWPETRALMDNMLSTPSLPTGRIRLTQWAAEHADTLGRRYACDSRAER